MNALFIFLLYLYINSLNLFSFGIFHFKPIESDSISFLQIIVSPKIYVNQTFLSSNNLWFYHIRVCVVYFIINVWWILNSIAMETIKPRKIKLKTTQYNKFSPFSLKTHGRLLSFFLIYFVLFNVWRDRLLASQRNRIKQNKIHKII